MKIIFKDVNNWFDPKMVVTNPEGIDQKTKKFKPDGVFSEKIFGKLDGDNMSYTCECGGHKGEFYKGKECPICKTEVRFTEPMLQRTGWIDLGDKYIISPLFFKFIEKLSRKKTLINMIDFEAVLDVNGNIVANDEDKEKNPYRNIGMDEFRHNFDEIIQYIYENATTKEKDNLMSLINNNRDKIFINKIPIYSITLRPALMIKDTLKLDEVNNYYNLIIRNSNLIKAEIDNDVINMPLLYTIQNEANKVFDKVLENIKGKDGFIRNNMIGSRINFSSRNVITPLPKGYKLDEVVLPYLTFLELYKFHIINIISRVKKITIVQATNIWYQATTNFSNEIYDIMMDIINKTNKGCKILLNRNPTIAIGSILCLNIAGVKKDYTDLTLGVNNVILSPLNGDYDGDTLNIVPIFDDEMKKVFSNAFSPKSLMISNNNGKFNYKLNIERDQALGIYTFNNA